MIPPSSSPEEIRLQLWLSRAGVASRRQAEKMILAGRVSVEGALVNELGTKVRIDAKVSLDGKILRLESRHIYVVLNKPAGYLSSMSDPEGRKIAIDLIKAFPERIYNVGRLDQWSSGLLLFTNDGEFARGLSHPSSQIEKEYEVQTDIPIPEAFYSAFYRGIIIDKVNYKAKSIRRLGDRLARIVLIEGKNREIRRVLEAYDLRALSLRRIRIGELLLGDLKEGCYRELSKEEVLAFGVSVSDHFVED